MKNFPTIEFESITQIVCVVIGCTAALGLLPAWLWQFSPLAAIMSIGYEIAAVYFIGCWMKTEEEKEGVEND